MTTRTGLAVAVFVGVISIAAMANGRLSSATHEATAAPNDPIRAAFYYDWFPAAWNQSGINPYTKYHPSLGYYDDTDIATVKKQIAAMQYGNIGAGIVSWWGQGDLSDMDIPTLLQAAHGTSFQWTFYYEDEGIGNPNPSQIANDLTYIRDHYGSDPNVLHIDGKFVVFVYADPGDDCGMADRWRATNAVGAYVILKVINNYTKCSSQPDWWHQYAPANSADSQGSYSYTISPGFNKVTEGSPRLSRDLNRWRSNVQAMAASGARLQLITTFNEWGEGTAVESASEWSSASGYGAYLDVLHDYPIGTVQSTPTRPTPTPTRPASTPTATGSAPTPTPGLPWWLWWLQ